MSQPTTTTPAALELAAALSDRYTASYDAIAKLVAPLVVAGDHFERRELAHELVGAAWLVALGLMLGAWATDRAEVRAFLAAAEAAELAAERARMSAESLAFTAWYNAKYGRAA
jgi:hypothetical protein